MMDLEKAKHKKRGAIAIGVATLVGVAVCSALLRTNQSQAQTTNTPAINSTAQVTMPSQNGAMGNSAPTGTFKSNENPTHEAHESPQREAQENAGQFPTVR